MIAKLKADRDRAKERLEWRGHIRTDGGLNPTRSDVAVRGWRRMRSASQSWREGGGVASLPRKQGQ